MSERDKQIHSSDETRALVASLNLDPNSIGGNASNPMVADAIYKHPTGGGCIYVGSKETAGDINALRSAGINHVVNCTFGSTPSVPNYHETGSSGIDYLSFPVSGWQDTVTDTNDSIVEFTDPLFNFVEDSISKGSNVLVHCMAGANRAGTTGILLMLHYTDMDVETAVETAKSIRPVIDSTGHLLELLERFKSAKGEGVSGSSV